jgi:hypothetical protein
MSAECLSVKQNADLFEEKRVMHRSDGHIQAIEIMKNPNAFPQCVGNWGQR